MKRKINGLFIMVFVLLLIAVIAMVTVPTIAAFDYRPALIDAVWFYDGNKCGPNVAVDNVFSNWRGACHTTDGSDVGQNLSGGFHDSEDHIKIGITQGYAASALGWSLYEYKDVFDYCGNTGKLLSTLKYFCDYFLTCHPNATTFYYQVGDHSLEMIYWGPPELQTGSRPTVFWADPVHPASNVCGMTSGALALMYLNYKSVDATYANCCLQAAKELYALGKNYLGNAGDQYDYPSTSYWDDLAWAAMWLYVAEGNSAYLTDMDGFLANTNLYGDNPFTDQRTMYWDDMYVPVFCKMAQMTGLQKYKDAMTYNLNYWKNTITTTPGGLKYLDSWYALQYAAGEAMIALFYYEKTPYGGADSSLVPFAKSQIDYILGNNPANMSYMIGFGNQWPLHPRHRAANGYTTSEDKYQPAKHTLTGGVVGGPNSDDTFPDNVDAYMNTTVGISSNAGVVGALAAMIKYIYPLPTPTPPTVTPTIIPTPTATPAPSATAMPTADPTWIPYLPTAEQVNIIPVPEQSLVNVDITFPSAGYRVADPGQVAVAAGIMPDGTTRYSNLTTMTKIEQYTGVSAQVLTTIRITYQIHYGDTTYFAFQVFYYQGTDQKVKDITIYQQTTPTVTPVTPTPTPTISMTPTPSGGGIKVQMYNSNTAATSNMIYPQFKLINTGTSAISLSDVKIRYYYTIDGVKAQNFYCDYSPVGSSNITGMFVSMTTPKSGADYYLEIGFTSNAGSLAAGENVTIQTRFAKTDWSNYTQTNDYSFNPTATTYVDWTKATGYTSGVLKWGTEP